MRNLLEYSEEPQEPDRVSVFYCFLGFCALVIPSATIILWSLAMLASQKRELRPSLAFPEQRLLRRHEVSLVQQDLFAEAALGRALNARGEAELRRFEWASPGHDRVRIPIDRAIDLRLREGRR